MSSSDHAKGLLITALGVLILTPDAVLIRLIQADPWTIVFWRGIGFSTVVSAFVLWRYGPRRLPAAILATGWAGLAVAAIQGLGQSLFVYSVSNTLAANTLIIIAAAPLVAAMMARLFLGEPTPRRTIIAGVIAFLAVLLTVQDGLGSGRWRGDLAAFAGMLLLAALFVVLRHAKARDMLPAIAGVGLVAALLGLVLAPELSVPTGSRLHLAILVLVVLPVSFMLISTGPRYLPAPEVALLMLLETVIGPFWVWLAVAERPSTASLVGGAVIIGAVAFNAWAGLRAQRRLQSAAA